MPLREMVDFKPSQEDMAILSLDIIVYLKISLVSLDKKDNYDFIRYLFSYEDFKGYFKELNDTIFYDFDGRNTDQMKFVTIFEMYSLFNFAIISEYLKEILEGYSHEADVLIDLYTHDDHEYRLSNLDGIVKLEQLHIGQA